MLGGLRGGFDMTQNGGRVQGGSKEKYVDVSYACCARRPHWSSLGLTFNTLVQPPETWMKPPGSIWRDS
jgi:hypothetical protein